jgi:phosphate/sulfate permease
MRGVTDNIIWKNILSQEILTLVYSAIIAIILFYIINSVTTRLRPVFLSEKGYKI